MYIWLNKTKTDRLKNQIKLSLTVWAGGRRFGFLTMSRASDFRGCPGWFGPQVSQLLRTSETQNDFKVFVRLGFTQRIKGKRDGISESIQQNASTTFLHLWSHAGGYCFFFIGGGLLHISTKYMPQRTEKWTVHDCVNPHKRRSMGYIVLLVFSR